MSPYTGQCLYASLYTCMRVFPPWLLSALVCVQSSVTVSEYPYLIPSVFPSLLSDSLEDRVTLAMHVTATPPIPMLSQKARKHAHHACILCMHACAITKYVCVAAKHACMHCMYASYACLRARTYTSMHANFACVPNISSPSRDLQCLVCCGICSAQFVVCCA